MYEGKKERKREKKKKKPTIFHLNKADIICIEQTASHHDCSEPTEMGF